MRTPKSLVLPVRNGDQNLEIELSIEEKKEAKFKYAVCGCPGQLDFPIDTMDTEIKEGVIEAASDICGGCANEIAWLEAQDVFEERLQEDASEMA